MTLSSKLKCELLDQACDLAEACGVLWGTHTDEVLDFSPYPGPLFAHHFRLCDDWLLEQCYQRRILGHKALGFYHFHPEAKPCLPSTLDLRGHPPGAVALILSSTGIETRAFRRLANPSRFEEVSIISA